MNISDMMRRCRQHKPLVVVGGVGAVLIAMGWRMLSYTVWVLSWGRHPYTFSKIVTHEISSQLDDVTSQMYDHAQELDELAGLDQPKTYLVGLMNSSESKPDGGFWGSYAIVTLDRGTISLQTYDAYYPAMVSRETLPFPSWMSGVVELPEMSLVGSNRYGFTDIDGANIKTLYDRTFGTDIDGVILINDALMTDLVDEYPQLKAQRHVMNAYADQIAGTGLMIKKQEFLKEIKNLTQGTRILALTSRAVRFLSDWLENGYMRVYLPRASSGLSQTLQDIGLTNVYRPDRMYVYDLSFGMNKADQFVSKQISLFDADGKLVGTFSGSMMDESDLVGCGDRCEVVIEYTLDVPREYLDRLQMIKQNLGVQYDEPRARITLLEDPQRYTQGMIYLPAGYDILSMTGELYYQRSIQTPWSPLVVYRFASKGLWQDSKRVRILLQKKL